MSDRAHWGLQDTFHGFGSRVQIGALVSLSLSHQPFGFKASGAQTAKPQCQRNPAAPRVVCNLPGGSEVRSLRM